MCVTGHFVDSNWQLQKRVLSFMPLPPPHTGVDIIDGVMKSTKDWGIEHNIFTISVDNASNNDVAFRIAKETFSRSHKLPLGGKLFHVSRVFELEIQKSRFSSSRSVVEEGGWESSERRHSSLQCRRSLAVKVRGGVVVVGSAGEFHQYQVVGRALPSESDEHPKIYRMKLWATNEVRAKSKFWYFLRKLKKVKKANGQVLAINEIFEKNPTTIKNFGIWLRYQSRTGYHNMYKEYRDTTLNGAVEQMYNEMASRHRVRHHCIQIIKTATVPAKLCKRESTKQFHNSKIKFPLVFKKVRPPSRKLKTTYKASKPNLFV
nr:60S ribosomal protein L18a [Ipomoea batatas]